MTDPRVEGTQAQLLALLDRIEKLLGEVRDKVIDGDPEMHAELRKAQHGEP